MDDFFWKLRLYFSKYKGYRIDFDPTYAPQTSFVIGKYMLFGFNKKKNRWLLLDQTISFFDAEHWGEKYHTTLPPDAEIPSPQIANP